MKSDLPHIAYTQVNHHLASQWKDYFLDHLPRIYQRVSQLRSSDKPAIVAKKPSLGTLAGLRDTSSQAARRLDLDEQTARRRTSDAKPPRYSSAPRKDRFSDSVSPPSRSPTPPLPGEEYTQGKFRFTEGDKRFLVQYARYRLAQEPHLSKGAICSSLAAKVRELLFGRIFVFIG